MKVWRGCRARDITSSTMISSGRWHRSSSISVEVRTPGSSCNCGGPNCHARCFCASSLSGSRWATSKREAPWLPRSARAPPAPCSARPRPPRKLEREGIAWSFALALLIRASLLAIRGDRPRAIARFEEAESALRAAGLALFAESSKRRRGQLIGGDRGDELVSQSESWMTSQGIRNPARIAAMCAPGFDGL